MLSTPEEIIIPFRELILNPSIQRFVYEKGSLHYYHYLPRTSPLLQLDPYQYYLPERES
jgi:hypothetical protein